MSAYQYSEEATLSPSRRRSTQVEAVAPPIGGANRVLIYSHDTFGLGHFRRCIKIAREIRQQSQDAAILLLTGSPLAHQFTIPEGVDFVKLPSVLKTGSDEYRPRSLNMSIHNLVEMRSRIIRETALAFHPDAMLVDHAPLGLRNEVLPALESLRGQSTRPALILGLRDIIDDPESVIESWRKSRMYHAINQFFDRVVIYGHRAVYDTCSEYEFTETLKSKTSYVGFISGSRDSGGDSCTSMSRQRPMVLVTVGGGEDGGQIVDTFIAMLRRHADELSFDSVILPGPLLPESRIKQIRTSVAGLPVQVHHFVGDMSDFLSRSGLVISMGGYNAVAEIMAFANRAILIPREWPRREQLIRAERMAAWGCADMLRINQLEPNSMWDRVCASLESTQRPLALMREEGELALDGASNVAGALLQSIRHRQNRESDR